MKSKKKSEINKLKLNVVNYGAKHLFSEIHPITLKVVAHYLNRIESFFIIYFVMHHADIPFNLDYNSFKLLRTDSTLFFNTRLFLRKSHRDLFSVASNICFFFLFSKYVNNQHVVSRFLSN